MGCAKFTAVDGDGGIPSDFSLEVGATQRITQGTTVTVPISVVRSETSASDIRITMNDAPAGVTAALLVIPATATTGNLEITVGMTAPQGPFNVNLQASEAGTSMSTTTSLPLFVRGPAGSPDTTFAKNGWLMFGGTTFPSSAMTAFVSGDDSIFVMGGCSNGQTGSAACVARLTPEGALDTAYGKSGIAWLQAGFTQMDAVLLPDGRMIVGGGSSGKAAYIVVTAEGIVGSPIVVGPPVGKPSTIQPGASIQSMALAPDGSVAVVFDAKITNNTAAVMGITKLTNGGQIDTTFGTNGLASADFSTDANNPVASSYSNGVAVRPSTGKIVIAGSWCASSECSASSGYGILQLNSSGNTYDTSFGQSGAGGRALFTTGNKGAGGTGAVLLPDGRVISPTGDTNGTVVAFAADGSGLDQAFGTAGYFSVKSDTTDPPRISLDDRNRLLAATGATNSLGSVSRITIAGVNDPSFGSNGYAAIPLPTPIPPAQSALARVQQDGRIVVFSEVADPTSAALSVVVSRLWN